MKIVLFVGLATATVATAALTLATLLSKNTCSEFNPSGCPVATYTPPSSGPGSGGPQGPTGGKG